MPTSFSCIFSLSNFCSRERWTGCVQEISSIHWLSFQLLVTGLVQAEARNQKLHLGIQWMKRTQVLLPPVCVKGELNWEACSHPKWQLHWRCHHACTTPSIDTHRQQRIILVGLFLRYWLSFFFFSVVWCVRYICYIFLNLDEWVLVLESLVSLVFFYSCARTYCPSYKLLKIN